jgi:MoxR-like ATPase
LIEAFDKNKSLFDPDRITLEESERLRSSFVSDFPIDKIQAMKLDEYVPSVCTTANKFSFHYGCVTKAIKDNKFLLIDEFNRADMNKAFGEMFLAIDHGIIQLREDEIPDGLPLPVVIPSHFRMICTMNDYDKSLLNDLSYGLLRRFAFVEIRIPNDREELKSVIKQRVIDDLSRSNSFLRTRLYNIIEEVDVHITKLIDLIYTRCKE